MVVPFPPLIDYFVFNRTQPYQYIGISGEWPANLLYDFITLSYFNKHTGTGLIIEAFIIAIIISEYLSYKNKESLTFPAIFVLYCIFFILGSFPYWIPHFRLGIPLIHNYTILYFLMTIFGFNYALKILPINLGSLLKKPNIILFSIVILLSIWQIGLFDQIKIFPFTPINKGMIFLENFQNINGSFNIYEIEKKGEQTKKESPYSTSFILDLVENKRIRDKGSKYLYHTSENGLWRFYPGLENPTLDVDDTAMASRVLIQNGFDESFVKTELLLEHYENGGFRTWIKIKNQDPVTECVSMNVLYLFSSLKEKNKTIIEEGCEYLIKSQNSDGWWNCSWGNENPYLSQYLVSRNYKKSGMSCLEPTKSKILNYLQETQNGDGGWGSYIRSNPLDTALAVLSLKYLGGNPENVERGIEYLIETQRKDGSWELIPLFTMHAHNDLVVFGSPELTTAFAVAALSE
jgi:hypothetical protein